MAYTSQYTSIAGKRAIIECILAGKPIAKIWLQQQARPTPLRKQLMELAQQHTIPYSQVPLVKLNKLTSQKHQGAVAYLSPIPYASLHHIVQNAYEKGEMPLLLLLDSITDPHNVGAIARAASCAGAHALVVPTQSSALINATTLKTSAGALAHLPICRTPQLSTAIDYLKKSGLSILACTEKATQPLYACPLRQPIALLLGAEDKGIHPKNMAMVDISGKIPMYGPIASLNVAAAAAIATYEIAKQRT